jgi:hypothetical protein
MVDDNIQGDFDTNTNTCLDLQLQAVQVSPATPQRKTKLQEVQKL